MIKSLTPLFYFIFVIPMTGVAIAMEAWMRSVGILGDYMGVVDLPLLLVFLGSILLIGVPVFGLTNVLIAKMEKPRETTVIDHLRQSLLFYMLVTYCAASWGARGFSNTETDGYLLLWTGIALIAIAVNYVWLLRRR